MAEANHRLQQITDEAQARTIIAATMTLALQRAKKSVQAQLRAKGLKLAQFSARDIGLLAEAYLDQHRAELLAGAKAIVERWMAEGFFGKRAQRAWRAKLESDARRSGHCSSNEIAVQNSSAERRADQ